MTKLILADIPRDIAALSKDKRFQQSLDALQMGLTAWAEANAGRDYQLQIEEITTTEKVMHSLVLTKSTHIYVELDDTDFAMLVLTVGECRVTTNYQLIDELDEWRFVY